MTRLSISVNDWIQGLPLYFSIPLVLIGGLVGLTLFFLFGFFVLIIPMAVFIGGSIVTMRFVEHKTASGLVGTLGFALLFFGFVLQVVGTYAGASPHP